MTRYLSLATRHYSVPSWDWMFVTDYAFLSFAKDMSKNIG